MSIPDNEKRRCYNCKFYMRQDRGYSNYTVEETEGFCLKGLNVYLPANEGYSHESNDHPVMKVAESCDAFEAGVGLHFDVDREGKPYRAKAAFEISERFDACYYSKDPAVIAAYAAWWARENPDGE